jgi:hypothetical protein
MFKYDLEIILNAFSWWDVPSNYHVAMFLTDFPSELPNDLIQRHSPRRKRTVASSVIDTSRSRRTLKTSRKEVPINYDSAIAIAKLVSWWCYVFNSIVNHGRFMCLLFTNISTKVKERCSFNKKIIAMTEDATVRFRLGECLCIRSFGSSDGAGG